MIDMHYIRRKSSAHEDFIGRLILCFTLAAVGFISSCGLQSSQITSSKPGQTTPLLPKEDAPTKKLSLASKRTVIWFIPNQLAGSEWWSANGHLQESFGDFSRWTTLRANLLKFNGGFGTYAPEIGHMNSALLAQFRDAGIPMDFEMPAWTQCYPASEIAQAELNGKRLSKGNINIFETRFKIKSTTRSNPDGQGWFVSADGVPYQPDSLTLDHRYALTDVYLPKNVIDDGINHWRGPVTSRCALFKDLSGEALTERLVADYVAYAEAVKAKWPIDTPRFSFHWNVHPLMELTDKTCVTVVNENVSTEETRKFVGLISSPSSSYKPCMRTNYDLGRIIEALCKGPGCPDSVGMDVDWRGNPRYIQDLLKANKETLAAYGVSMGINLVNQAEVANIVMEISPDKLGMVRVPAGQRSANQAAYESQVNLAKLIVASGVYDRRGQALRIQTWNKHSPIERGAEVGENVPYSAANAANRVFSDVLDVKTIPEELFIANQRFYSSSGSSYCSFETKTEMLGLTYRASSDGISRYLNVPSDMKFDGNCRDLTGFFSSQGAIYAGNALYHYCKIETNAQASLMGVPNNIPELTPIPTSRIFDGGCWLPRVIFRVGNENYRSDGVGHYCRFDTLASFQTITTLPNSDGLPILSLPTTMTDDGICR
jgi:hypothetical protein